MKLPRPVHIDMLEVLRTGRFDALRAGLTKEEVLRAFPDPDGWAEDDAAYWLRDTTNIWAYGELELHFEGSRLARIYSDYVDSLHGEPSLEIDPWIFGRDPAPTLKQTREALNRAGLAHTVGAREPSALKVTLPSGIELLFEPPGDRPEPNDDQLRLVAFTLRAT